MRKTRRRGEGLCSAKRSASLGRAERRGEVANLLRDAQHVFPKERITILSDRDRKVFLSMLEKPPHPNEALRKAGATYKRERA